MRVIDSRIRGVAVVAVALLGACANLDRGSDSSCVDHDGDGFGLGCARGVDCNDNDPSLTTSCVLCAHPGQGCACAPGAPPLPCFEADDVVGDGTVICHEGTRYCRDGRYGACEDVHAYTKSASQPSALVDPNATPVNCSICDVACFKVTDPLLADAGAPGSLSYGANGGVSLTAIDAGAVDAGVVDAGDGGAPSAGCGALELCCQTLYAQPSVGAACQATVDAADDASCDAERALYCASTIIGPIANCVPGVSPIDSDCDGIPDGFDECTAATLASDPSCNGSVMPLPTTTNQTIFHVIGKAESASNALEIGYKVQNADVYFLLDTTDTMSEERDALVNSLTNGDLVECALLKNCCDRLSGAMQSSCLSVVNAENQGNCQTKSATYCSSAKFLDCPDLDFDGSPDNYLKGDGVVGAIRCIVGSSWFGAGYFREIPFRDGVQYYFGDDDQKGIQDHGNSDEQAYRHVVDMTPDYTRIDSALMSFQTAPNYDYPEADIVALYSLATGKGQMFGNNSVAVAERLGSGCASNSFGYPCFRSTSIPIVVLFTDDPLNNGPPGYSPQFGFSKPVYDASYSLNGKAPSSGVAHFTPQSAETFASADELGDVTNKFVIASGNTRFMNADYNGFTTGCFPSPTAPDAVVRFELSAMGDVPLALNVAQDPLGYNDSFTPPNLPTPATEFPVVMTLYAGDPTNGGSFVQCQRVCANIAPYNSCHPLADKCNSNSDCCSNSCKSNKCSGSDPAGEQACYTGELASNGFTAKNLKAGSYYVTIKGRRSTEKGFYELQVGDPNKGTSNKYVPPSWTQARDALVAAGIKVLPVLSCKAGSNNGRCDGAAAQLKTLAQATGAVDATKGNGLLSYIDPDGTGLGGALVLEIRDLANYLSMDITLSDVGNPGFVIQIQKCTNKADPSQSACTDFTSGCTDPSAVPVNTIASCLPGALPVFHVTFSNPAAPNDVPLNPSDPYGGYHFKLQLVGNHQHLLEEIPVYIIPADSAGPPPPPPNPTYMTTGSYEQDVNGEGCVYYLGEGEGPNLDSCTDGIDNDGDGKADDQDEDCMPGSCLDGNDNDYDGLIDLADPNCQTTARQDWTDLFFKADIPFGSSIDFAVCTGNTLSDLDGCSFTEVAHVTSAPGGCASDADCTAVDLGGGVILDGFCGTGGQCQFIDPPKQGAECMVDADCPNGSIEGALVASHCDTTLAKCVYRTPPAGIGEFLPDGDNGKPYARLRVTLNASSDQHATPTLYDWYMEYLCQSGL